MKVEVVKLPSGKDGTIELSESVFGLVHAGWRGLVNGIFSESGIVLKYNDHVLTDFEIVIGPSIQNCCFEVSDDVVNQFDPSFVKEKKNGKYRVDLQGHALDQLGRSGFIKDKNSFKKIFKKGK